MCGDSTTNRVDKNLTLSGVLQEVHVKDIIKICVVIYRNPRVVIVIRNPYIIEFSICVMKIYSHYGLTATPTDHSKKFENT